MKTAKSRSHRALFAFSADPITNGHLDVIERAAAESDHLIVAVLNNDAKAGKEVFTADERVKLAAKAIAQRGYSNVSVTGSSGLLTDLYLREGCDRLYRGVRNEEDRRYEKDLIRILATILPHIREETRLMAARPALSHVSSSLVKMLVSHHVEVSGRAASIGKAVDLVPMFVKAELESRISKQVKIGVTGGIAVGKTTVAESVAACVDGHHINVDGLIRELYAESGEGAQRLRDEIERVLGDGVLTADRRDVNRSVMGERLFSPTLGTAVYDQINALTAPHVERKYREALKGKTGVIMVEWAQMAEMRMSHWVNHRVIVVDSPDRERFAEKRGIEPARLASVRAKQWSADRKAEVLEAAAKTAGYGRVLIWQNRWRDEEAARQQDAYTLRDHVSMFPGCMIPNF